MVIGDVVIVFDFFFFMGVGYVIMCGCDVVVVLVEYLINNEDRLLK